MSSEPLPDNAEPTFRPSPQRLSVSDLLGRSLLRGFRGAGWINLVVILGVVAVFMGIIDVSRQWQAPLRDKVDIDLSLWALPKYTLFSFTRGMIAYALSLLFTIGYAYWAAYDRRAERFLIQALDALQSLPVMTFLPGLVLACVSFFPHSNVGLEIACILMIFTGQVWNMTFSFYYTLKAIPQDYRDVGRLTGMTRKQFLFGVELPMGASGLVFNSMISMAGGWFFLMTTEAFTLGDHDFRLPGIGSYMSVAQGEGDIVAQIAGGLAMVFIIVVLDQLLWYPLVVLSQRFKMEETQSGPVERSWFLEWIMKSTLINGFLEFIQKPKIFRFDLSAAAVLPASVLPGRDDGKDGAPEWVGQGIYFLAVGALVVLAGCGVWQVILLLKAVPFGEWLKIFGVTTLTGLRVFATIILGTLWTVPVGIWIGKSQKWRGRLQPIIQIIASFPAPMLFVYLLTLVLFVHGTLEWGAIVLMLAGAQWYILFNIISGASVIPAELDEYSRMAGLSGWVKWTRFYLPAIFPSLVTGWVTAEGGAWNASIVSEYVEKSGHAYTATGVGAYINTAMTSEHFGNLAAASLVMIAGFVLIRRVLWKPLQRLSQDRFRILN
ncbi:NitT/TauT family transport system permease protein [Verrucomicrobium sp. GAS474]|uniref:ABC transporter permease n=1 Tax=Verrucomicrobium sp. GAS474 TaxID=1882831 RepID=UPI00087AD969|nr:ABC transporter permease subunit [Verrucomicrobium sp. GAS474]SDU28356.1 NitT/TauT family transport system permease protein [Verrucomicrobium sp. GAS474]